MLNSYICFTEEFWSLHALEQALEIWEGGLRGVKPWTKMCHLQSLLKFTKSGQGTRS